MHENHGDGCRPVERRLPRHGVVERGAKTVNVGSAVERLSAPLLRRHVPWCSRDRAFLRHAYVHIGPLRQSEIHEFDRSIAGDNDVFRLDVSMNDPDLMGALEGARGLLEDIYGVRHGHSPHLADALIEGLAGHELHRDKMKSPVGSHVNGLNDVWV